MSMSKPEIPWRYLSRAIPTILLIVLVAVPAKPLRPRTLLLVELLAIIAVEAGPALWTRR
jgi:hypothetical protein